MSDLKLLKCLAEIQNMCIGKLTMGYQLDEMYIGEIICNATGMKNPDLNKYISDMESEEND